ncbi:MAG: hypothetical protein PHN31_02305 [Candidatus Gracilibacteria bacterium]|nr:hypothetical protein [Candidatus Gracilibacteria bacterium]
MQEVQQETKKCKNCDSLFDITQSDIDIYKKLSPIFGGSRYDIPYPALCPDCRQQRRLAFRTERKLYKRKCDITGKNLISVYSPNNNDIVYEYDYWWSDKWDAIDYGVNFDFSKTFFKQIQDLSLKVPKPHIEISFSENCEFTNQSGYNKNSYLIFEAGYNENCLYSRSIRHSTNTIDVLYTRNAHNCYECIDCENIYNVKFSYRVNDSKDSQYLFDCNNCEYCIGCWNLIGKKYFILNKQYTKKEYEEFLIKFNTDSNFRKNFIDDLHKKKIKLGINKNLNNLLSQNVLGDGIISSKNSLGYNIKESEDCRYCYDVYLSETCMDYTYWGNNASLIYECLNVGNGAHKTIFCLSCYDNVDNLIYCINCVNNSSNCFGCVGLKNKSYCIFNKQYSKDEYEILVPQIIAHMQKTGEWGEFFPPNIFTFGYNNTVAMEYYPLTKEQALEKLFLWDDYEQEISKVEKIISANKLPDNIKDIPDDILNRIIECEITKKPFRIIKQELEFYRKHNLPIPRKSFDQRHLERMQQKNQRKLFDRKCDKCGNDIKTTYPPEMKGKVYGAKCYDEEIY